MQPLVSRPACCPARHLQSLGGPRCSQGGAKMNTGNSARRGSNGTSGSGRFKQGGGRRSECDSGRVQRRVQPRRREQVSFRNVFSEDPMVAIIGGGLAGLVLSIELAAKSVRSVVFDTGEHGVGGRLATRDAQDGSLPGADPSAAAAGAPLVFDHAAQYFTATDPAFVEMVREWEADGAVRQWQGRVGELRRGSFTPLPDSQPRYVATNGMRSLAQYLAAKATKTFRKAQGRARSSSLIDDLVEVRRPQWVSDILPIEEEGRWRLMARSQDQGLFDAVVIAHNGKCANRLTEPAGIPQVYSQLRRLKLSANWVQMVAFARPLPLPDLFEGAFILDSPVLSWAANNTAKLGLAGQASGVECWTLISTQEYGWTNKVPQENVSADVRERVAQEMLEELARCLGLPSASSLPPLVYTRVQLWGAALPQNSPAVPCIWDPQGRAGVCGDWVAGGGSMQAAALSGRALAECISSMRGLAPAEASHLAAGLTEPLKPVGGPAIGQFPGDSTSDVSTSDVQLGERRKAQGQRAPQGQQVRRQPVQAR